MQPGCELFACPIRVRVRVRVRVRAIRLAAVAEPVPGTSRGADGRLAASSLKDGTTGTLLGGGVAEAVGEVARRGAVDGAWG